MRSCDRRCPQRPPGEQPPATPAPQTVHVRAVACAGGRPRPPGRALPGHPGGRRPAGGRPARARAGGDPGGPAAPVRRPRAPRAARRPHRAGRPGRPRRRGRGRHRRRPRPAPSWPGATPTTCGAWPPTGRCCAAAAWWWCRPTPGCAWGEARRQLAARCDELLRAFARLRMPARRLATGELHALLAAVWRPGARIAPPGRRGPVGRARRPSWRAPATWTRPSPSWRRRRGRRGRSR